MEPAGVRMPSLVPPMTQLHTTSPSTATGPAVVLLSVPFPGSVHAAFRMAQAIKALAGGRR
jgi:hypothetical protein